jgi:serine/threonine-protein phosphatase 6 catalytic subunit
MGMDLDGWIARVKSGEHLEEWDLKQLCDYVKELLIEESNVQVGFGDEPFATSSCL